MKKSEVRQPRYIYKLEILCGLSLIQKDVFADTMTIRGNIYVFHLEDDIPVSRLDPYEPIAYYPVNNTIITEVINNPDYIVTDNQILGYGYRENDLPF